MKDGKGLNITEDQRKKCHAIIHAASVAAGGAGAAGAQLPVADNTVIVPAQITMIIALGKVFDLDITKSVASGIIKSAAASFIGRTASQVLVGWIPGVGNAINSATAAGITETIGWMTVKEFSEKSYNYKKLEETDEKNNSDDDLDRVKAEAEENRDKKQDDDWANIHIK